MEPPPFSIPQPTTPPPPPKLRLMCSYGGHIVPRPHDKTLCYVGGDTRIIVIDRHTSLSDLHHRLSKNLFNNQPFSLKYQLPTEDLDSLITLTSDEDLENMVDEYDRLNNGAAGKPGRLRLFLFPKSPASIEQLLVETASNKSEDWFFNALNGKSASDRGFSETSSLNCLLGLDDEFAAKTAVMEKDVEAQIENTVANGNSNSNFNLNYGITHDVHSVPGSPMLETTSSFGSTSSTPSLVNLPPIRVHVEENPKIGIEDQFHQMSVGICNPPPLAAVSRLPVVVGGTVSDDERSDHSRKAQQLQLQPKQIPQFQQKQANNFDLASPDSASSDRQRQAIYQEPLIQIQSGNTRISSNQADHNKTQFQESVYQYDQNQPQFLHPNNQYPPYYSVYPSQPQQQHQSLLDQQYPFYFVHPNSQTRNAPSSKPEMGSGVYRTNTPQFIQMPSTQNQPQYVGFTQIHHPSSGPNSTFAYEFADPTHAQMYYTPLPPQLAAKYQTLTSATENIKQQDRTSQA